MAGARSFAAFAASVLAALAAACPGTPAGGPDGGLRGVTAVIDEIPPVALGAEVELHGERSVDPTGRAPLFAWSVVPPEGDCAGVLEGAAAPIATYAPKCVGTHEAVLVVSDEAEARRSFEVVYPSEPIPRLLPVERAWRGFPVVLDASASINSEPGEPTASFTVTPPGGCADAAPIALEGLVASFSPSCAGVHVVDAVVRSPSGEQAVARLEVPVVESLVVEVAPVEPAVFGATVAVTATVDPGSVPPDVDVTVRLDAEPLADTAAAPPGVPLTSTFRSDGATAVPATFPVQMSEPHGSWRLSIAAASGDVATLAPVLVEVSAANARPTITNARQESAFQIGETAVVVADVADAEGDPLACTATLLDGDPAATIVSSTIVDGTCRVVLDTPEVLDVWRLSIRVEDDHGGAAGPVTVDVAPQDLAPVIAQASVVGPVGYACASGCASEPAAIVVDATDDIDAPDELDVQLALVEDDPAHPVPDGVVFEAQRLPGAPASFSAVLRRADRGPLAGTYAVRATVTQATSFDPTAPLSTSQVVLVEVQNAAPTIQATAPVTVQHSFSDGRYRASVVVQRDVLDPEGNETTSRIELVACPSGAAPGPACGAEPARVAVAVVDDGAAATFTLDSAAILDLVGAWSFRVTASDADGASAPPVSVAVEVRNRAPDAFVNLFADSPRQIRRADGLHEASIELASSILDPDGDPISITDLEVTCPDGSVRALAVSATCADGVALTRTGDTVVVVGPAIPTFLGAYRVDGTYSDGAAPPVTELIRSTSVLNDPPSLARTSAASQEKNHLFQSGLAVTATGESFVLQGTMTDLSGDLLDVVVSAGSGYTVVEAPPSNVAPGALSFPFRVQVPFSTFKSTRSTTVSFRLVDEFGATSPAVAMTATLKNRAPVLSLLAWGPPAEDLSPHVRPPANMMTGDDAGWVVDCSARTDCPKPPFAPLNLEIIATDPDGDPLFYDASDSRCGATIGVATFDTFGQAVLTSFTGRHALTAGGHVVGMGHARDGFIDCPFFQPDVSFLSGFTCVTQIGGADCTRAFGCGSGGTLTITDDVSPIAPLMPPGSFLVESEDVPAPLACP